MGIRTKIVLLLAGSVLIYFILSSIYSYIQIKRNEDEIITNTVALVAKSLISSVMFESEEGAISTLDDVVGGLAKFAKVYTKSEGVLKEFVSWQGNLNTEEPEETGKISLPTDFFESPRMEIN